MSLNYVEEIVEEVALEGLDGITLPDLLKRLRNRQTPSIFSHDNTDHDERILQFIWNVVRNQKCLSIIKLPVAREELVVKSL
jgi:hypothetical protein